MTSLKILNHVDGIVKKGSYETIISQSDNRD